MHGRVYFIITTVIVILAFFIGSAESKRKGGVYIEVVEAIKGTSEEDNKRSEDEDSAQDALNDGEGDVTEPDQGETQDEAGNTEGDVREPEEDEDVASNREVIEDNRDAFSSPDFLEPGQEHQEEESDQKERFPDENERHSE